MTQVVSRSNIQFGRKNLVRTSSGIPYIVLNNFADDDLRVYKGNSATPTSFSEQDASNAPSTSSAANGEPKVSCAIDSSDIIHIVYFYQANSKTTWIRYITFNTSTDSWGSSENAATVDGDESNIFYMENFDIAVDGNDVPHIVFNDAVAIMGSVYYNAHYANRVGGSWNSAVKINGNDTATNNLHHNIIIRGADNYPVITYHDATTARLAWLGNQNNASSFAASFGLVTTNPSGYGLVEDSAGDILFFIISNINNEIEWSKWNGGLWTSSAGWDNYSETGETINSNADGYESFVAIGTDVYIIWCDNSNIVYSKITGGTSFGTKETFVSGNYDLHVGKWAYHTNNDSSGNDRSGSSSLLDELEILYMDGTNIHHEVVSLATGAVTANAGHQTASITQHSATVSGDALKTQNLQSLTITIHSVTVVISTSATGDANLQSLSIAQHSASAIGDALEAVNNLALNASLHAVTINAEANVDAGIQAISVTIHSLTVGVGRTVTLNQLTATITQNAATAKTGNTVALNLISASLALLNATTKTGNTIGLNLLSASIAQNAITPKAGNTVPLNQLLASISQNAITPKAGNTVSLNALSASLALLAAITKTGNTVDLNQLTAAITQHSASAITDSGVTVNPNLQTITITLHSVSVSVSKDVALNVLSLVFAQHSPSLSLGSTVGMAKQDLTLAQHSASGNFGCTVSLNLQTVSLTQHSTDVNTGNTVSLNLQTATLNQHSASVLTGKVVALNQLSVTLAALTATPKTGASIDLNALSVTLAAHEVTAGAIKVVNINHQGLNITLHSVSVIVDKVVSLSLQSVTITQEAATVAVDKSVSLNLQTVSIAQLASTVAGLANVNQGLQALNITPHSLSIQAGGAITVNPNSQLVTITLHAISVRTGNTVAVNKLSISLAQFSVSIGTGNTVQLNTNSLNLAQGSMTVGIFETRLLVTQALNISALTMQISGDAVVSLNKLSISLNPLSTTQNTGTTVQLGNIPMILTVEEYSVVIDKPDTGGRSSKNQAEVVDAWVYLKQFKLRLFDYSGNQVNAQPYPYILYRPIRALDYHKTMVSLLGHGLTYSSESDIYKAIDMSRSAPDATDDYYYDYRGKYSSPIVYFKFPIIQDRNSRTFFHVEYKNDAQGSVTMGVALFIADERFYSINQEPRFFYEQITIPIDDDQWFNGVEWELTQAQKDAIQTGGNNKVWMSIRTSYNFSPGNQPVDFFIGSIYIVQDKEITDVPLNKIPLSLSAHQVKVGKFVPLNKLSISIDQKPLLIPAPQHFLALIPLQALNITLHPLTIATPTTPIELNHLTVNITAHEIDHGVTVELNVVRLTITPLEADVNNDLAIYQPRYNLTVTPHPIQIALGSYVSEAGKQEITITIYSVSVKADCNANLSVININLNPRRTDQAGNAVVSLNKNQLSVNQNGALVAGDAVIEGVGTSMNLWIKRIVWERIGRDHEVIIIKSRVNICENIQSRITDKVEINSEIEDAVIINSKIQ